LQIDFVESAAPDFAYLLLNEVGRSAVDRCTHEDGLLKRLTRSVLEVSVTGEMQVHGLTLRNVAARDNRTPTARGHSDRLLHRATVINVKRESFRLIQRRQATSA
jgi:hypothetical protein